MVACEKVERLTIWAREVSDKSVNILKAHGKSAKVRFRRVRVEFRRSLGMQTHVERENRVLDFNLQKTKMLFGIQVLVNDPKS